VRLSSTLGTTISDFYYHDGMITILFPSQDAAFVGSGSHDEMSRWSTLKCEIVFRGYERVGSFIVPTRISGDLREADVSFEAHLKDIVPNVSIPASAFRPVLTAYDVWPLEGLWKRVTGTQSR
jgi:hypothetical protein